MIRQFIWLEPVLIFALILANGLFAAAEIAIIATRKSRIDALLEKGVKSAAAVARLKNDPDRFLATVQIGVTVVSSLASAIGGAAAIGYLQPSIEALPVPLISRWSEIHRHSLGRAADFLFVSGNGGAGSEVAGPPFLRAHRLPHRTAH